MRQPLFGLSAAGPRLEGGFNGPGEPANQWSAWELAGKVPAPERPGRIWSHPDEVLEVASAAGAEVLALSVEWARVEPRPGLRDGDAVDRYASIFERAASRGVSPIAVLHDVAHPAWLGEEFWLTPGSPDRFAEHVARLVASLSPYCRQWVTLRQPNLVALAGWLDGRHPPRRVGALSDAWAVVDNFLSAHVLAFEAIRDAQADAEVLLGLRMSSSYDWQGMMVDLLCAPGLGIERGELDSWIAARRTRHDDAVAPSDLTDLAWRRAAAAVAPFGSGRFARRSPRRVVDLAYRLAAVRSSGSGSNGSAPPGKHRFPLDALLVGCVPPRANAAVRRARGDPRPWEVRPDPEGLAARCRDLADAVPGLPIWVEDGFATHRGTPRSDGWDRSSYVRAQLRALEGGGGGGSLPVAGYLYYAPIGGGDPTWPDADFGLGADADLVRQLVDGGRRVR